MAALSKIQRKVKERNSLKLFLEFLDLTIIRIDYDGGGHTPLQFKPSAQEERFIGQET